MTSRDFCFWLQGAIELADPKGMTPEQLEIVKRHLALVFVHEIDPSAGGSAEQAKLDAVHSKPSFIPNKPGMRC
jgi:hypothetical protein